MKQSTMVMKNVAVSFEVDGRMVIADPCYIDTDDGTVDEASAIRSDLAAVLDNAVSGKWVGEVEMTDDTGGWGRRVSVLRATADGCTGMATPRREGNCLGVDSGQMYIGDAGNAPLNYDRLLQQYRSGPGGDWEKHDMLAAEGGIVSSTGVGDGCYPLYVARNGAGQVTQVEVRFFEDDEEDS